MITDEVPPNTMLTLIYTTLTDNIHLQDVIRSLFRFTFYQFVCGKSKSKAGSTTLHLSMAMFSSFGGGHLNNLARTVFDHHMAILAQR